VFADARAAWDGPDPDRPADVLRIEAAAVRGRPVYFYRGPADEPDRFGRPTPRHTRTPLILVAVIMTSIFTAGSALAWHNWRRGRANPAGAARLAAYAFLLVQLAWASLATHVPSFYDELSTFAGQLGGAVVAGALLWVWYLALEPYVRRRWPWLMVSWNRLLAGRWRDPLVGRDLLLGGLLGVTTALLFQAQTLLPHWLGRAPPTPLGIREDLLGQSVGLLAIGQLDALFTAQGQFFMLFVLVLLLRRSALAVAVAYALHVLMLLLQGTTTGSPAALVGYLPVAVPVAMTSAALVYVVLLRYGFLAHVAGLLFAVLLGISPLTTDLSAWYAGGGLVCALALVGLAVYGFVVVLSGRPLFGTGLFGDE
jgi:serine/threonine-protein kinase